MQRHARFDGANTPDIAPGSREGPSVVLLVLVVLLTSAGAGSAQVRASPPGFGEVSYWGMGYAANAPQQLAGLNSWLVPTSLGGWGLYVDAKIGHDSPARRDTFDETITVTQAEQELGDDFQRDETEWTTVNGAVARALTPDLSVYAGAGYARETTYREYLDSGRERGRAGFYWVEDESASESRVNLLAGALLRFGRYVTFQLGAESAPTGFTGGIGIALPDLW